MFDKRLHRSFNPSGSMFQNRSGIPSVPEIRSRLVPCRATRCVWLGQTTYSLLRRAATRRAKEGDVVLIFSTAYHRHCDPVLVR